ncbi:DUF4138 domain-containing protein [Maribacter sp. 2210JD10-5]|uniref:DUF4138 domain-containing protein n=1 Tax=Maribacter sp. 2210JD10-5 TaxID=3386272 RepID=UPI0039BCE22B
MRHFIVLLLFALLPYVSNGQTMEVLDTIYANMNKNVTLFFPEPIRRGITGSENFVFTYNREKEDYYGLLQATPGKESNLLVINKNGAIFSYIVKYKRDLPKLNYFVPASDSIGNEKPDASIGNASNDSTYRIKYRNAYFHRFCSYLADQKRRIPRLKKTKEDITLRVANIVFDRDEFYFVIQIENRSSLAYDLNFLDLSIQTRPRGKRKSLQTLSLKPKYRFGIPERIAENETKRLVYVLPKFSLSADHKVIVELNEKNGSRNPKVKISHKYINNPN